jgi:hypothetical protein
MEVDRETVLPFDLAILNSYILLTSCGGKKISHRDFQITLPGNMLTQAGQEQNVHRSIGRTPTAATKVVRLEERGRKRWPIPYAKQS